MRRLFGNVTIPSSEIQVARAATSDDLRGLIRVWGSGAFFGYYGSFRTSKLGNCTWYVTDRQKCVVCSSGQRLPHDPLRLIAPSRAQELPGAN